jgi:spore coat polysaccharide biosynthesis predicted glycosyltransferase SpsG
MTEKLEGRLSPIARMPHGALLLADAGNDIGLGHVVRSCALATALMSAGWRTSVATPDDPAARSVVSADGIEWREWPDGSSLPADLLVVDSYRWTSEQDRLAIAQSRLLIRIMDGAVAETSAHVVIDGAPGADPSFYRGARLQASLAGPQFALVPRAFRDKGLHRDERAVVALGSGGSPDLVARIVAALVTAGWGRIDVVAGPYTVLPVLAGVDVHRGLDPRGVAGVFARARLGVVGGGQTLLQAAASGLACVAIVLADNQRRQVDAMVVAEALIATGDAREPAALERLLGARRPPQGAYAAVAARARSLVDGYGADRAAAGIIDTYGP